MGLSTKFLGWLWIVFGGLIGWAAFGWGWVELDGSGKHMGAVVLFSGVWIATLVIYCWVHIATGGKLDKLEASISRADMALVQNTIRRSMGMK